ncbi:MAG: porin, partial [Gammaproteobacteria bacterium]|nr:porin [Gammaproteobacteria bacterium]
MNKKLIAAAVAATVAPVAAQAQVSVYGRINNAVDIKDIRGEPAAKKSSADGGTTAGVARTAEEFAAFSTDNPSTTDISGVASRFGVRYSGDIGGGMTALGRYEFATTTDKEGPGVNDTRIATVGVQGPFGTINVGNQWSAFFNTVGTHVSPTYSLGYYLYSSVAGMPFRASNTVKYSN